MFYNFLLNLIALISSCNFLDNLLYLKNVIDNLVSVIKIKKDVFYFYK